MSNPWQHYNIFCCYAFKSIIWIWDRVHNLYELVSERVQILEPGLSDSWSSILSIILCWTGAKDLMETWLKLYNPDSHVIIVKKNPQVVLHWAWAWTHVIGSRFHIGQPYCSHIYLAFLSFPSPFPSMIYFPLPVP